MATHARTTEKPDPRRVSRWRESMDRRASARRSRRSPAPLLAELGYRVGDGPGTEPRVAVVAGAGSDDGDGEAR